MRMGLWIISTILFAATALAACSDTPPADTPDTLTGFWRSDNGLYYLDMSETGMVAFMLPHRAATLTGKPQISLQDGALRLEKGGDSYALSLDRAPKASGERRCMVLDQVEMCESRRE